MIKGSKGKCESPSHKEFKEKAKTRLEAIQGIITNLQTARTESRPDDISALEQMVQEWNAELNEPSPAPSLSLVVSSPSNFHGILCLSVDKCLLVRCTKFFMQIL